MFLIGVLFCGLFVCSLLTLLYFRAGVDYCRLELVIQWQVWWGHVGGKCIGAQSERKRWKEQSQSKIEKEHFMDVFKCRLSSFFIVVL